MNPPIQNNRRRRLPGPVRPFVDGLCIFLRPCQHESPGSVLTSLFRKTCKSEGALCHCTMDESESDSRKSEEKSEHQKLEEEINKAIPRDAAELLQGFLSRSLSWSGQQLERLSDSPFVDRTGFARAVKTAGEQLKKAALDPAGALEVTLADLHQAFEGAMDATMESYRLADSSVKRSIMENVPAVSIMGPSFTRSGTDVRTSLRKEGKDISPRDLVNDFRASGKERIVLFVPGLFSDETLWSNSGTPFSFEETVESLNGFCAYLRFPPLQSIPRTGAELLSILDSIRSLHQPGIDIVSYSEGGLILRSALYLDKNRPALAGDTEGISETGSVSRWIRHALMISSPDAGSFLEKMGFWIGLGLAGLSQLANQLLDYPELERSQAIKDLGRGRIRPEEESEQLYFGELDDIPATQIYSLLSKNNNVWESWLGDGVVEEVSLAYLSARVYATKENAPNRVHCILGRNHFQILNDPATSRILRSVLMENFSSRPTGKTEKKQ